MARRGFAWGETFWYALCLVRGWRVLPGIATLAQSVERLTRNEQVDSSILSSGSSALGVKASRVLRIRSVSLRYGYLREWRNW